MSIKECILTPLICGTIFITYVLPLTNWLTNLSDLTFFLDAGAEPACLLTRLLSLPVIRVAPPTISFQTSVQKYRLLRQH